MARPDCLCHKVAEAVDGPARYCFRYCFGTSDLLLYSVLLSPRRNRDRVRTLNPLYTERVSRVVKLLQGKWTIQIICAMRRHPVRLSELKRAIPSASKKSLTASLRSLENARVVLRRDLSSSVLHVEYELAETMREPLVSLLDHLAQWGKLYDSEGLSGQRDSSTKSE